MKNSIKKAIAHYQKRIDSRKDTMSKRIELRAFVAILRMILNEK